MEKTIEIPEGYEAQIEGNKVILKPKESEDEKIRKEMLNSLKEAEDCIVFTPFKKKSWIAYLEKLKDTEQNIGIKCINREILTYIYDVCKGCVSGVSKEDFIKCVLSTIKTYKEEQPIQDREEREYVRTLKSLIADFLRGKDEIDREYYQKIYDWLDGRHIEQKPVNDRYMEGYMAGYAKGHKDAEKSYNRAVSYHLDTNVINDAPIIDESMEDKDATEPTPKQDYSGLTDFERALHRGFLCAGVENVPIGIIKDTAHDCLAHIKPAEWSEEDEKMLKSLIAALVRIGANTRTDSTSINYTFSKEIDWLKSLRPHLALTPVQKTALSRAIFLASSMNEDSLAEELKRIYDNTECVEPIPHWKPSEEQMEALKEAVYQLDGGEYSNGIDSLINDLQKLL